MLRSGWSPQFEDKRDYKVSNAEVQEVLNQLGCDVKSVHENKKIDLRSLNEEGCFSDVVDQGQGRGCTAIACAAAIEFGDRKFLGQSTKLSYRTIYEICVEANSLPVGSWVDIRSALKSIKRFGAPPSWITGNSNAEISPLISHGFREESKGILFFKAASLECGKEKLHKLKCLISAGWPIIFGFPIPSSADNAAVIPYRPLHDSFKFGQAALMVGFDDNAISRGRGAVLFKNSWGSMWGDSGYGWLPYEFVTESLARDFWVVIKSDWVPV